MNHQDRPYLDKNLYGGGPQEKESVPDQRPERQEAQRQGAQVKTGIIGSMYPHVVRGMAPGGGEEDPLPPGKRGPPDDKSEEDSEEEGDDESDIDEDTESVTSSSQSSAGKMKQQGEGMGKRNYQGGAGGPPEDPDDPLTGGIPVRDEEGLGDIGANEEELDLQREMELLDPRVL